MDALVHWDEDDSENVVSVAELRPDDANEPLRVGTNVKMWWPPENCWWNGRIVAMEYDIDPDDVFEDPDFVPHRHSHWSSSSSSDSSDSDSDAPLSTLIVKQKSTAIDDLQRPCPVKSAFSHIQQHGRCASNDCPGEVYAACPICLALLCHDHFADDQPCCEHPEDVYPEQGYPVEGPQPEMPVPMKRKGDPSNWKKNVAKRHRNLGLPFAQKGAETPTRRNLGPRCPESCKRSCREFSDPVRISILNSFWDMESPHLKWAYINRYATAVPKKQSTTSSGDNASRRSNTLQYYLPTDASGKSQVCKKFFLGTLNISEKMVRTAVRKATSQGTTDSDLRGKHGKQQQAFTRGRELVCEHINLFPKVESHYVRNKSKRHYLSSNLSVAKMYRLYMEWLDHKAGQEDFPVKELQFGYNAYWKIFDEFALSFFRPKKDQCGICEAYHAQKESASDELKAEFDSHVASKDAVRHIKETLKQNLLENETLACFDLQQVLGCPHTNIGEAYYKRQLSCYNLTVFDVHEKEGFCYFWREDQGHRGPNEIGSVVYSYLKFCSDKGKNVAYLFADSTSSQNRNSVMAGMIGHSVWASGSALAMVRLHFFEKYHGQNEGDSVHSVIESAKKKAGSITHPSQYITLIRMAKSVKPYVVTELDYSSFLDFGSLTSALRVKTSRQTFYPNGSDGPVMNWNKLRVLEARRSSVGKFFVKFEHDSEFLSLPLRKPRGRAINPSTHHLAALFSTPVGIDKDKKADLISMFGTVILQESDKSFYRDLPLTSGTDVVEESDSE